MPMSEYDVAIAGGGPAGAAAALTLLRYSSLRVVLVELSDYRGPRIGETVSPALGPLLVYLGVWERFTADAHLAAYSTAAAWGCPVVRTHDFLFSGQGNGWHLDRRRFDLMLAEEVVVAGGTRATGTVVAHCERHGAGWLLSLARDGVSSGAIQARFVIDASGRRAALARRLGARQVYDRLAGVTGFVSFADGRARPALTLVEACPSGWWYSAPLPGARMVAAWMSDIDLLRAGREHTTAGWRARLAEAPHTRARLEGGRLEGPLHLRPAGSQLLMPAAGRGWAAAGDAAASFDPLSSLGIGHAISSGIQAARVAHATLCDTGDTAYSYSSNVARVARDYLALRRRYYAVEQRWPDQPFWARRQR